MSHFWNVTSDKDAHSPNRNANGMLSLFPEAEIMASETNGPITADVLPTFYAFVSFRCAEAVAVEVEIYHREERKEEEPRCKTTIRDHLY